MNKVTLSVLISVGGVLLSAVGFSDTCSNEILGKLPLVIAGLGAIGAHYFHNDSVGRTFFGRIK